MLLMYVDVYILLCLKDWYCFLCGMKSWWILIARYSSAYNSKMLLYSMLNFVVFPIRLENVLMT